MIFLFLFAFEAHAAKPVSIIKPPEAIYKILYEKAEKYQLDPVIFEAMIRIESAFNPKALNQEGKKDPKAWSRGLGQVQYYTALKMEFRGTPQELYDPEINLEYAARYLKEKLDQYGTYAKAISAYNAGQLSSKNWKHVNGIMNYAKRLEKRELQVAM